MLKLLFFIWLKPFDLIFYPLNGLKPISIEYDIRIFLKRPFLLNMKTESCEYRLAGLPIIFFSDQDHQNQN